ncbi:MAG: hypothetical protein ABH842_02100 [Candidatus Micrarchaeota archaeon]
MSRRTYAPSASKDLDRKTRNAVGDFSTAMRGSRLKLDPDTLREFSATYANVPTLVLHTMLLDMEPSHVAHLMIGLGDYKYRGIRASDRISALISRPHHSEHCIRQDGAGVCDYHPWQTFAYGALAGVHPDKIIASSRLSFRDLALNSRVVELPPSEYHDLGHLLVGAALLTPDRKLGFTLSGRRLTLEQIVEIALNVHKTDDERPRLCFDFHLTEGLTLATASIPGLQHMREQVKELLDLQLQTLTVIGALLAKVVSNVNKMRRPARTHEEQACFGVFCNQCNSIPSWIGHALELAAVAEIHGFELTQEQKNTITFVANTASELSLMELLQDDFAVLAHWRRALTLILEIDKANELGRPLSTVDFSAYSVDFDRRQQMGIRLGDIIIRF